MLLTHVEKWRAFIMRDSSFDGVFYTAVKTTGIFCKPSCRARKPLEKNVIFYDSTEEARKNGFRPCKICEPEGKVVGHLEDITKNLRDYIDLNYSKQIDFLECSKQSGLSQSHLARVFKKQYALTPKGYLNRVRINHARKRLKETDDDIMKLAYDVGFLSLSSFYKNFKVETGKSPKQFRKDTERASTHV